MEADERPPGWLTVEAVARLRGVDVTVVRAAIKKRELNGVTTHPDHRWQWMVRRCDADAWRPGPVIRLPGQPAASAAEASSSHH